jgi:hypothetical protein
MVSKSKVQQFIPMKTEAGDSQKVKSYFKKYKNQYKIIIARSPVQVGHVLTVGFDKDI